MKLDFNEIPVTDMPKFKGGEKSLAAKTYSDEKIRILRGTLVPGASIGLHVHETSNETIYIISGSGRMLYDDTEEALEAGDCHYCPRNHRHSLINNTTENLVFMAVITEL